MGGLARRASYLKKLRQEGEYLLVDAGDFSGIANVQGRIQAETVLESMVRAGYHAAALGERELALGRAFVDSIVAASPFPFLAANVSDPSTGRKLTKTSHVVSVGGYRVGIVGVVMKPVPGIVDTSAFRIEDPIGWARELVSQLRPQVDYVVVLAHVGWGQAFSLASQVQGIDVVVVGHGSHASEQPQRVGNTLMVQAGDQGKKVGVLRVENVAKGKYSGMLVPLDSTIPDDPQIRELVSTYNQRVSDYYSRVRAQSTAQEAVAIPVRYAGAEQCKACHSATFERWAATRHAHAMETLRKQNKEYDPECVRCHSTGFGKPTGFISLKVNPQLAHVQCEQCHGQGSLHIAYRTHGDSALQGVSLPVAERARKMPKVSLATCLACHTPERDSDFTYREGDLSGIH